MLSAGYPSLKFEVVNCSMVAINSHGVLQIARECAAYQPDLFVIHLGNNEVVGPFGAAGVLGPFTPSIRIVRANLALKRSRVAQLTEEIIQRASRGNQPKQVWNGMAMLLNQKVRSDDARLTTIYSSFRTNLEDIVRSCRDSGAQVVLCTVPVNLRDCAPFASLHAPGLEGERLESWQKSFDEGVRLHGEKKYVEALSQYRKAEAIDPEFAELEYRIGQCALSMHDNEAAQAAFVRARDLDAVRFRTDSTLTNISREVAAENQADGVRLADGTKAFARAEPTGLPGHDLFLEHVHMTFKGNYLLGKEVYDTITKPAQPRLVGVNSPPLTEEEAAVHLGHSDWSDLKFDSEMYERLIQEPPFTYQFDHTEDCRQWEARLNGMRERVNAGGKEKALARYAEAAKIAKNDWMICCQYGELLYQSGYLAEAEHQLRAAISRFQHCWEAQCLLGAIEMQNNKFADAEKRFRYVLRFNPKMEAAYLGLADILNREGKSSEGLALLENLYKDRPKSVPLVKMIASILVRAKRFDEAEPWLRKGLELDPDEPKPSAKPRIGGDDSVFVAITFASFTPLGAERLAFGFGADVTVRAAKNSRRGIKKGEFVISN
jgi:tetratricopeptide (TPR) repeat protein